MGSQKQKLAWQLAGAGIAVVTLVGASVVAALGAANSGWPTYQHDAARSGLNSDAGSTSTLSAAWNTTLDGKMYAQPLVVGSLVYAATENNTVYAFDVTTGAPAWQQHLAAAAHLKQLPCGNIDPYGITGTPVIDTANGVLYTAVLEASPNIQHELYALDLRAGGAVLYHYPIDAPGSDPGAQGQRGALTLANNKVYVPFAGRWGDCATYTGRVVGVSTGDTTGASMVSYALPNTGRGGIWAAASADSSGNLYVASGNSDARGSIPDRGESVIKLSSTLQELDYFTAPEWSNLNSTDTDIGSIGPIVLQNGWILQSGKNGMGYLLNSAHLGQVGGQLFEGRICDSGQEALAFGAYLAPDTVFIPCSRALKAVKVTTGGAAGFSVTTVRAGYSGDPGASPPIIAGGLLWNLDVGNRLLLAFDPATRQQVFAQALMGTPAHFVAPSSGAGHVFVPSGLTLEAFSISGGGVTPTPTSTATATPTRTPMPSVTPSPTSTATAGTTGTTARFVGQDNVTQGSWKGTYGAHGYWMQGNGQRLPTYAQVRFSTFMRSSWATSTSDPRGLQKVISATDRIAAAWYHPATYTVDVNLNDRLQHQVSLYALDWDSTTHTETVDVLDARTGALLDSRSVNNFAGGVYLTWTLSGHVLLRITQSAGGNAVISGIFF